MLRCAFVLLTTVACAPEQEDAPPTLDEYLHTSWQGYAAEDLAGMGEDTLAVDPVLPSSGFVMAGNFSDISADEVALVALDWEPDPEAATGFYVVDRIGCTEAQIEQVLTSLNQDEIYSSYTAYQRDYTTDSEAFFSGETDVLYWETTYSVGIPLIGDYTMHVIGGTQRILGAYDEAIYVTRTYAPSPAEVTGDGLHFEQDYQIEVFFPRDGEYVHVYGMWRQFGISEEGTQDDDLIHNSILSAMEDYFGNTTEYCATL